MYGNISNHRIPISQKNAAWKSKALDAYLSLSDGSRTGRKQELQKLYEYYNGTIHAEDYD